MTIEEYDKKKELRRKIADFAELEYAISHGSAKWGFGMTVNDSGMGALTTFISDPILIERFKQLLLERKQELINEFEKE